jgi:hypothetical protein
MNCINRQSKEFINLLDKTGLQPSVLEAKIITYQDKNGINSWPSDSYFNSNNNVNFALKSIDILDSDKGKQIFDKGKKAGWTLEKILSELQIPKEQKQLILDLGITDREQLALELASKYGYSVEINTTKELNAPNNYIEDQSEYYENQIKYADKFYVTYEREGKFIVFSNDYNIERNNSYGTRDINSPKFNTKEEAELYRKELVNNKIKDDTESLEDVKKADIKEENTKYYSNLTVPGGTNYTENEISTPAITPSIEGHAQFSTDNGIGHIRMDERINYTELDTERLVDIMEKSGVLKINCK